VAEIEKQLEAKEVLLLQRRLEKLGQGNNWKMEDEGKNVLGKIC